MMIGMFFLRKDQHHSIRNISIDIKPHTNKTSPLLPQNLPIFTDLTLRALMMQDHESYNKEVSMFSLNSQEFDSKYTCWTSDERIARNFLDDNVQKILIEHFAKNMQLICFARSIEIRQTKPLQITMIPNLITYGSAILHHKRR